MRHFGILLLALFLSYPAAAFAEDAVIVPSAALPVEGKSSAGEAFAVPNAKDMLQTYVMLDGVDIKDPKKADDYARLMYCSLYEEKFSSDFEWNTIRTQIIDRVKLKKEPYRTFYEISGIVFLGRYNFETQDFPLVNKSSLFNVSSLVMMEDQMTDVQGTCLSKYENSFPRTYVTKLKQPLTVDRLKVPLDEAEKLLAKMERTKNKDRRLYIRFRVRLNNAVPSPPRANMIGNFIGDVIAIDVFYDKERTRFFGNVPVE